jgi:glucosamine--fructose-6-phosphate aminotransferase (isomerizing)
MANEQHDWLTDEYPELRDGPPWVMAEMIDAQPGLVGPILGAKGEELRALRSEVMEAARSGSPVVVTGCGTSEHAALVVAELLSETFRSSGLAARAVARQALDAALDPQPGGVCIAVSHNGRTRPTQLALQAARAHAARTALITACEDPACRGAADHVFLTPRHDDSWCHTLAYTSAILAGATIAGQSGDEVAQRALSAITSTLDRRADFEAAAAHLHGGRIVTAGIGIDLVSASELALKIAEGSRLPTAAYHLETILHGYLAGCDAAATGLVLFGLDPRLGERGGGLVALVARAACAIGMPTVLVASGGLSASLPDTVCVVALDPLDARAGLLPPLLQSAVALQLLTLGLVGLTGTNPDLIRREEDAYREAAQIGKATPGW